MRFLLAAVAAFITAAGAFPLNGLAAEPSPREPRPIARDEDYELYKTLVDTMDQVERNYVDKVDRRKLMEAAIRGVLSELDPYSSYIAPDALNRFKAGVDSEFGGVGIQIAVEGGQLKVISPLVGSPAYRAGVLAGDRIVAIDGQATDGVTLDDATARLQGAEGSRITLTVMHPGRTSKETIAVVRERIRIETVLGDGRKADDAWDFMLRPGEKVGYIRIVAFSRETPQELKRALDELTAEGMRGLVLDLRFNPGGLLTSAIEVSDLFVSEGKIVSTEGRSSPSRVWFAHRPGTFEGFPMVVLVNRYSASASEIVAACLQDHGRAAIVGERTWGKGSVQNLIEIEQGHSALKLTTASYHRPSGRNIHREEGATEADEWGVLPDPGCELKVSDREMVRLHEDRRERDIVRPHESKPALTSAAAEMRANAASLRAVDRGATIASGTADPVVHPANRGAAAGTSSESGKAGDRAVLSVGGERLLATGARTTFVDRQLALALKTVESRLGDAR